MFIEPDHTEREDLAALRPGLDVLLEIRRQDTSRSFSLFHHANCQRDE